MEIKLIQPDERKEAEALLADCQLPTEDLHTSNGQFWGAYQDDLLIGTAALEVFGSYGLLRSVAVAKDCRDQGHAQELTAKIESEAAKSQITSLFLITTTASGYFQTIGYRLIDRSNVPAEISRSTEFGYLCPQSASVLTKEIKMTMKNILVLCTGNSCRSQIAEGYLRDFAGDRANIYSAGVETHGVNPKAIEIMAEDGIDISAHTSNNVDEYVDIPFDYVITVCDNAKERCPFFPTKAERFHQNFPDPAKAQGSGEEIMAEFRQVRDMIKDYSRSFIATHISSNTLSQ